MKIAQIYILFAFLIFDYKYYYVKVLFDYY